MARCAEQYPSTPFSIKKLLISIKNCFIRLYLKVTFMAKPCYDSMLILYQKLSSRTDMQAAEIQIANMLRLRNPKPEYRQILQCIDQHLFTNASPGQSIAGSASQPGKNATHRGRNIPEPQVVKTYSENVKLASFREEIRRIRAQTSAISNKTNDNELIEIIATQIDSLKDLIEKIENIALTGEDKTAFDTLVKEAEALIYDLRKRKALTELARTESEIGICKQAYREEKTSPQKYIIELQSHIGKLSGIYGSLDRISLRAWNEREQILALVKNGIEKRIAAEQGEVLTVCQKLMDNIKKECSPSTIGQLAENRLDVYREQTGDIKTFLVCFALFSTENEEKLKRLRQESQDLHEKIDNETWRRIEVNECQSDEKIQKMQNKVNQHIEKIRNIIAGNTDDTIPYEKQLQIVAAKAEDIIVELDGLKASAARKAMVQTLLSEIDKLEARQNSIKQT